MFVFSFYTSEALKNIIILILIRAQPMTKQRNTPKHEIAAFTLCLLIGCMSARRKVKELMRPCIHTHSIPN